MRKRKGKLILDGKEMNVPGISDQMSRLLGTWHRPHRATHHTAKKERGK